LRNIKTSKLFNEFLKSEKTGGVILIIVTIISIILANSFISEKYIHFWHQKLDLSFFNIQLDYTIQHWINDGLMTIFFLLVGLEIERELYIGELSSLKIALLPIIAALGGMLVPAAIHFIFNHDTLTQSGAGIPMATDIAFALGVLSLIGKKIPASLKIFLTALAIIDDLGAIIIIAVFYSKNISAINLLFAFIIFILLLMLNRLKYHHLNPYLVLGLLMWYFILKSGVHPTITGVLLAFAIPFYKHEKNPSVKLQHFLHKPVAYMILPLFAMANTAIIINFDNLSSLSSSNSLGIIFGLMIGKPAGILIFSVTAILMNLCQYPKGTDLKHILGAGILGGIGFTMSIFITNLAFSEDIIIQNSIISILIASLLSGIFGFIFFKIINKKFIKG